MKTPFIPLIVFSTLLVAGCVSESARPVNLPEASQKNVQLGLSYLSKGDRVRAQQKLLLALQQSPKSADAQDAMGYFFFTAGEMKKATSYYERAIQYGANRGEIQNNYGIFLCDTGHHEEAIKHFLKATEDVNYLYPAHAYHNAALCAQKIPDKKLAQQYFMKEAKYKK